MFMQDTYWRNKLIRRTQWQGRNDKDARRKTSLTIFTPHFICKGLKKVTEGLYVRGSWRPNINCSILTPLLWPSMLCLSCSHDARVYSAGCWLSLLHLISIFTGPQLIRAPSRFGLVWLSLPHLISNWPQLNWPQLSLGLELRPIFNSTTTGRRTQLSYIIVRRPLDFWNRMFNRHQAEMTVMQFTGHSLPVHQSMSVQWEFFSSSHFISQFPPTRFPLISAIRMCHLLPVHHHGMAFLVGSKGQNIAERVKDIRADGMTWWWWGWWWRLVTISYNRGLIHHKL